MYFNLFLLQMDDTDDVKLVKAPAQQARKLAANLKPAVVDQHLQGLRSCELHVAVMRLFISVMFRHIHISQYM